MARSQSSKRQMEKNRREKQAAKRVRRDERATATPEEGEVAIELTSQDDILAALAALHESYANGDLSLDDFDEEKEALVGRLKVD